MTTAILFIAWWLSGFLSFVHWHRRDFDVTASVLPIAAAAGLIGPLAFPVGWWIHGNHGDGPVIFPKR